MLEPHITFDPNESPLSYVAQLAKMHTGGRSNSFLRDLDIEPADMAAHKEEALGRLAELSGVPLAYLRANVAVPVGRRAYDLRGEQVSAKFLVNSYTVFCPACLAEDDKIGRRRYRWEWALSIVRTCSRHEISLLRQAKGSSDDVFQELEYIVPERDEKLQALFEKAEPRSVSPLQEYAIKRLNGGAGSKWLDSQSLEQSVRATELLGALVAFGAEQKWSALTSDERDYAGRVGFEFTSRGEESIREVLEAQFWKLADTPGQLGACKVFGRFHEALAYSKPRTEPGKIADILREVIIKNIAMRAGRKVLGVKLAKRHLHTVSSLAKEQNLDPLILREALVDAAVIPEKAPVHYPIPVSQGCDVASRLKRNVNVNSLPDKLACSRPLMEQLFADRLLTPIDCGRPGIKGKTQRVVDCEDVAMLVGNLHARAVELGVETNGLLPISKVSDIVNVPAITVVHMVLGGFLERVFRLAGHYGLAALRVDPVEVKRHRSSFAEGLSPMEAFASLKISQNIGWRLVNRDPKDVRLAVDWIVGPQEGHRIPRFDPVVVDDFKDQFIHPARIAELYGLRVGDVIRRLKRRGVRPELSIVEVGENFYRTCKLQASLFS